MEIKFILSFLTEREYVKEINATILEVQPQYGGDQLSRPIPRHLITLVQVCCLPHHASRH